MNGHTAGNHIRHVNEFKPTLRQGFGRTRMPWCRKPTKHREVFFQQRDTKRQQALWHAVQKKGGFGFALKLVGFEGTARYRRLGEMCPKQTDISKL